MNKNVKKAAVAVLYTLSIVAAIGIGMVQYEKNIFYEGKGGPGCHYTGYMEILCSNLTTNCVSGKVKGELYIVPETADFKWTNTMSRRGNCSGFRGCITPESKDLTSVGCAE